MLSINYESINYVVTQILKLSCASFSYVNISYVLAFGSLKRKPMAHFTSPWCLGASLVAFSQSKLENM